jgi:hypothetical protein
LSFPSCCLFVFAPLFCIVYSIVVASEMPLFSITDFTRKHTPMPNTHTRQTNTVASGKQAAEAVDGESGKASDGNELVEETS